MRHSPHACSPSFVSPPVYQLHIRQSKTKLHGSFAVSDQALCTIISSTMAGKTLRPFKPVTTLNTISKLDRPKQSTKKSPSSTTTARAAASASSNTTTRKKFAYPEKRRPIVQEGALSADPTMVLTKANKHYVFVYGTLKRGFANSRLLDRATYLGEFRTVQQFPLVVGGQYFSPYLLDIHGKGNQVKGELYAVDDAILADLDHLEQVGINYSRKVTQVSNCADRSFVADAYVYLKTNGLEALSKKPFLEDYQCRRYVPRHMRGDSKTPAKSTKSSSKLEAVVSARR